MNRRLNNTGDKLTALFSAPYFILYPVLYLLKRALFKTADLRLAYPYLLCDLDLGLSPEEPEIQYMLFPGTQRAYCFFQGDLVKPVSSL